MPVKTKDQGLDTQEITIKDLLEAGAHFGHQKHRWNPKMRPFIFEERNGIYIIDLAKTRKQLRLSKTLLENVVMGNKSVLFVGTKKPAQSVLKECAEKSGEFYVTERWLGGMLTNLPTIRRSVKKLEAIEKELADGGEGLTKKEVTLLNKQRDKLEKNLAGIRGMRKLPGLLIVVDPSKEHIAVAEANKLGIPVLALVDTNCDPDPIDHVIACNDDALKSIKLIVSALSETITAQKETIKGPVKAEKEESAQDQSQEEESEEETPEKEEGKA